MMHKILNFWKIPKLKELEPNLTRESIIKTSRILMIDDEQPELINDLKQNGFAIDYDASGNDLSKVERNIYDLIILDFAGIGAKYGNNQGLDVLRHIKRVNPAVIVLAYTSKSLGSDQSDFFRLTDGTLNKDAGVQESLEKIEESLRKASKVVHLWHSLLKLANISEDSDQAQKLELVLRKSIKRRNLEKISSELTEAIGSKLQDSLTAMILEKIFDLAIKSQIGQ